MQTAVCSNFYTNTPNVHTSVRPCVCLSTFTKKIALISISAAHGVSVPQGSEDTDGEKKRAKLQTVNARLLAQIEEQVGQITWCLLGRCGVVWYGAVECRTSHDAKATAWRRLRADRNGKSLNVKAAGRNKATNAFPSACFDEVPPKSFEYALYPALFACRFRPIGKTSASLTVKDLDLFFRDKLSPDPPGQLRESVDKTMPNRAWVLPLMPIGYNEGHHRSDVHRLRMEVSHSVADPVFILCKICSCRVCCRVPLLLTFRALICRTHALAGEGDCYRNRGKQENQAEGRGS